MRPKRNYLPIVRIAIPLFTLLIDAINSIFENSQNEKEWDWVDPTPGSVGVSPLQNKDGVGVVGLHFGVDSQKIPESVMWKFVGQVDIVLRRDRESRGDSRLPVSLLVEAKHNGVARSSGVVDTVIGKGEEGVLSLAMVIDGSQAKSGEDWSVLVTILSDTDKLKWSESNSKTFNPSLEAGKITIDFDWFKFPWE